VIRRWGSISRTSRAWPTTTKVTKPRNVSRHSARLLGKNELALKQAAGSISAGSHRIAEFA
jgi:hypothetical protein